MSRRCARQSYNAANICSGVTLILVSIASLLILTSQQFALNPSQLAEIADSSGIQCKPTAKSGNQVILADSKLFLTYWSYTSLIQAKSLSSTVNKNGGITMTSMNAANTTCYDLSHDTKEVLTYVTDAACGYVSVKSPTGILREEYSVTFTDEWMRFFYHIYDKTPENEQTVELKGVLTAASTDADLSYWTSSNRTWDVLNVVIDLINTDMKETVYPKCTNKNVMTDPAGIINAIVIIVTSLVVITQIAYLSIGINSDKEDGIL
jgi:hypothetical protein